MSNPFSVKISGKKKLRVFINYYGDVQKRYYIKDLFPDEKATFTGRNARREAEEFRAKVIGQLNLRFGKSGYDQPLLNILEAKFDNRPGFHKEFRNWKKLGNQLYQSMLEVDLSSLIKKLHQIETNEGDRKSGGIRHEIEFLRSSVNDYIEQYNKEYPKPNWEKILENYGGIGQNQSGRSTELALVRKAFDLRDLKKVLQDLKSWFNRKGHISYQWEPVYYYLFTWLTCFALRIHEACGLEWEDIDFHRREWVLTGQIQPTDEHGKVIRNVKSYRLKELGEMRAKDSPYRLPIPDELFVMLSELEQLQRSRGTYDRFVFANKDGLVPQYSKIRQKLMRTIDRLQESNEIGQQHDYYNCTHKFRKTATTWGNILLSYKDSTQLAEWSSMSLTRHSNSKVHDIYIDEFLRRRANPIPKMLASHLLGKDINEEMQDEQKKVVNIY